MMLIPAAHATRDTANTNTRMVLPDFRKTLVTLYKLMTFTVRLGSPLNRPVCISYTAGVSLALYATSRNAILANTHDSSSQSLHYTDVSSATADTSQP